MFPLIMCFQQLASPRSARLRIMRKPLVQRLRQLKQCAKLLEQSKKAAKSLDQLQSTFIDLAQQVHHIRVSVKYNIGLPPFDGYTYRWTWKGIIIHFCGSNTYFRIMFDFTRYVAPAVAEYGLTVY
jgi:HPt (histidine-containing phosphotransfer) domain-containing protein